MQRTLLIIGDTDALISTINIDAHHEVVKAIYRELASVNAGIYFPSAIIAETITTCQRRLKNPSLAEAMVTQLTSDLINVLPTDDDTLQMAAAFFHPHGSKENTFFDAIVAASAKKQNADAIFSFDQWYRKLGFKLASDLFEQKSRAT